MSSLNDSISESSGPPNLRRFRMPPPATGGPEPAASGRTASAWRKQSRSAVIARPAGPRASARGHRDDVGIAASAARQASGLLAMTPASIVRDAARPIRTLAVIARSPDIPVIASPACSAAVGERESARSRPDIPVIASPACSAAVGRAKQSRSNLRSLRGVPTSLSLRGVSASLSLRGAKRRSNPAGNSPPKRPAAFTPAVVTDPAWRTRPRTARARPASPASTAPASARRSRPARCRRTPPPRCR